MSSRYRVDDLVVDGAARQVIRCERALPISGLTFDLLWVLVSAAPALVSTDELMRTVWPRAVVTPETLSQRVKLLRRALGDTPEGARYIGSERGRGYRLVAAAQRLVENAGPASMTRAEVGSIAVMPFANLTGDSSHDYLGSALVEELVSSLARIPGLKVASASSTINYRPSASDPRRVGDDLGVATLLEGSIRTAGSRLRVAVRVVDTRSGFQLWSNTFERELSELLELEEELARQIVQALRKHLGATIQDPRARASTTRDVIAYQLYLQARAANRGTKETVSRAVSLIDQALDRDPNFGHALAYRAVLQAGGVMLRGLPAEMLEEPRQLAERALQSSPDLPDAHMAMGLISAMYGSWIESATQFQEAIANEPWSPLVRNMHALAVLRPAGRLLEALSELRRSFEIGPAEGFTAHEFAITHSLMGHDEEALRYVELTQTLSGMSGHWDLGLVQARAASRRGQFADAAQRATNALPHVLRPTGGVDVVRSLYAGLEDPAHRRDACNRIAEFTERLMLPGVDGRTRIFFITALVMLGDPEGAWTAIDRLLERAGVFVGQIDWSDLWAPEMNPLRRDPRFHQLVTRLKFEPYWRRFGPADSYTRIPTA